MKLQCKKCESTRYHLKSIDLIKKKDAIDDKFYEQKNLCIACGEITTHKIKYKMKENKYRYLFLSRIEGRTSIIQLHRYIMELILHRSLRPSERIRFKNGNKGDCRPSNLDITQVKRKIYRGI